MVLATAKVADFDQFWNVFSTQGAEKRGQHGSKGANIFRDPNDADRVWVVFDWDDAGWQNFTSDPDVPAIFQQAGFTEGPPKAAEFVRAAPRLDRRPLPTCPVEPGCHLRRLGLKALRVVPRAPNFWALRRVSSNLERAYVSTS